MGCNGYILGVFGKRRINCGLKGCVSDFLSLRTRPQPGVAIPRLEEKCIDNCPTERGNVAIFGGNRYLVPFNRGIATTSLRTGLAMTENFEAKPLNNNLPYSRFGI